MDGNMLLYFRDPASQMSPLKNPEIVGYKFRSQPSVVTKLLSRIVGHKVEIRSKTEERL
jgi:hypothetical protein